MKVSGPGVSKGVKPNQPTNYTIDTKQAGGGELVTSVKDEKGKDVPVNITDHNDGTYTAEYTAPAPGKYKVTTTYGGRPVPGSPVDIKVTPPADVSKVKVDGLEPSESSFLYFSLSPFHLKTNLSLTQNLISRKTNKY